MNALVDTRNLIQNLIFEYHQKLDNIDTVCQDFEDVIESVKINSCIKGHYAGSPLKGHMSLYKEDMKRILNSSAWQAFYKDSNVYKLCTPKEKSIFERELNNPPEFTIDNLKATFGKYIENPRYHMLRALAETFGDLDPAYKSHEKVKIGVKGLPKRVIISKTYFSHYHSDKLLSIINALKIYQNSPLATLKDIDNFIDHFSGKDVENPFDGLELKIFTNTIHLIFDKSNLLDINRALAEFYGDVLPDLNEDNYENKKSNSTAVAKDLQFYATPRNVAKQVIDKIQLYNPKKILEPSCGEGNLLIELKNKYSSAKIYGIELDASRANKCRDLGFSIQRANFLEVPVDESFDLIVMNPPFYGKHYAKHVEHAIKFLSNGGRLIAILPSAARYDHGILNSGYWYDLEQGSFKESGTNVSISVYEYIKR